ncbi:MAG: AAA family ATPase [Gammaproteobacteria bacterium]|nr:AAA family ATPase [Gammaproteobacteria bacterium]MYA65820.1 AAA family ATPase [Gammaproteobacteria bacterium]MYH47457.1 AAA family ATPase [Gammaproteobacteria bacterium]MYL12359.1 AAA family ATPase [Gammaproteobacteria bacterium]
MSQIKSISIQGFKSVASIQDLELRPLNVLIGANGSGKSNFFNAMKMLRASVINLGEFSEYVAKSGGADRLLHFGSKISSRISFDVNFKDDKCKFNAIYSATTNDKLYVNLSIKDESILQEIENIGSKPGIPSFLKYLVPRLHKWRLYHFLDTTDTSPMKRMANVHDNRRLREDGSNLSSFLYLLQEKYPADYSSIRHTVQLAAPFFDNFHLEPLKHNERMMLLEWKHLGTDAYFDASSFSDGTLRFIALATLLLQPVSMRPSVILLDEPEIGLHPYAIDLLVAMLRQASLESQIIVATQSPILLDYFEPEDVIVADRVDGATEFNRLETDRLAAWLEDYSLGELWEKNYLGGRPAPETSKDTQGE